MYSNCEFVWSAYYKIVQSPEGFLFYLEKQIFNWLPRHALNCKEDLSRLERLIQQAAVRFDKIK